MFKALMAVRLRAFAAYFLGGGRTKKPSRVKSALFAALMLYCIGIFGYLFYGLFSALGDAFFSQSFAWLFFAIFLLMNFALMFLTCLFTAKSQLYEAKDNELLLSLPFSSGTVLFARMLSLGLGNLLFELIVSVPFFLVWIQHEALCAEGVALFLLVMAALNLLCLAVSSLFALVLSRITAKMRKKTLFSTLFSLLFLGAYFFVVARANTLITALILRGEEIAGLLGAFHPLLVLSQALAAQSLVPALLPLGAILLVFVLVYLLLARSFRGIVTAKSGAIKIEYREKSLKVSSADAALVQKESARLLSSSGYILNAGLGVAFAAAGAILIPFMKARILQVLAEIPLSPDLLQLGVLAAILFILSTVTFSACSVSLEGECLWIVRSLPVTSRQILRAKLQLHSRIAGTAAIALGLSCALTFRLNTVLTVLIALFFALMSARIGLLCNLRHPFLNWTNEMQAVKQGISVLLAMFFSVLSILIPAGLYFALQRFSLSADTFMEVVLVLYVLANLLLSKWIDTKGAALFDELA